MKLACLAPLLAACTHVLDARDWQPRVSTSDCEVRTEHGGGAGGLELESVRHHDARGRLVSGTTRAADGGRAWERFAYDAHGRLVAITSHEERPGRAGDCDVVGGCDEPPLRAIDRVDLQWDDAGRLRRRRHRRDEYEDRGGTYVRARTRRDEVELEYDGGGRLRAVISDRLRRELEYDGRGRPIREIVEERGYPPRRHAITHDGESRIASRASLGQTYLFRHDDRGRVVRRDLVGDPELEQHATWEYDARGAVTRHLEVRVYRRSGVREERALVLAYDDAGRLRETRAQGQPPRIFTYAGACNAVRLDPSPPAPMGEERCLTSPHRLLQTCWW